MGREPSDATLLRTARSSVHKLHRELAEERGNNVALARQLKSAQQELAEWKSRFDTLLESMKGPKA